MKKGFLCLLLLCLSGCVNGYTLIREPDSDAVKIVILADENERELVNLQIENTEVVFCQNDCTQEIEEAENEYVDGLVAVGNTVLQAIDSYENTNEIPIIKVMMNDPLESLKKLFPQYQNWVAASDSENVEEADALYYEEGAEVTTDKPFYQEDNPQSICTLIPDREQLVSELETKISLLLENRLREYNIYLEWIVK